MTERKHISVGVLVALNIVCIYLIQNGIARASGTCPTDEALAANCSKPSVVEIWRELKTQDVVLGVPYPTTGQLIVVEVLLALWLLGRAFLIQEKTPHSEWSDPRHDDLLRKKFE